MGSTMTPCFSVPWYEFGGSLPSQVFGFSVMMIVWAFCNSKKLVQVKTRTMFLAEVN